MDCQTVSDKQIKSRSKVSDDELARMIEEDCKRNPSAYSSGAMASVDSIPSSRYFVSKTSACGIEQIRKWL